MFPWHRCYNVQFSRIDESHIESSDCKLFSVALKHSHGKNQTNTSELIHLYDFNTWAACPKDGGTGRSNARKTSEFSGLS